jgi:hypothetical protein
MKWKYIKGYGTKYRVYEDGRIQSMVGMPKFLKPADNGVGYLRVGLRKANQTHLTYVHRIVAEAFVPNPKKVEEVHHLDYVRSNNVPSNLEWVSRDEHIAKTLERPISKERAARCADMIAMRRQGATYQKIGDVFGVTRQRAQYIVNKLDKKHS